MEHKVNDQLFPVMNHTLGAEDARRTHFCEMPCFSWDLKGKRAGTYFPDVAREDIIHDHVNTWKLNEEFTLNDLYEQHRGKHIVILEKYKRPSEESIKQLEEQEDQTLIFPHDEHGVVHSPGVNGTLLIETGDYVCLCIMD